MEYNRGTTGDFFNGPSSRIIGSGEYVREMYDPGFQLAHEVRVVTGYKTGEFSGSAFIIGSGVVGEPLGRKLLEVEGHTGNYLSGYSDANLTTFVYASGTGDNQMMTGSSKISPYGDPSGPFIASGSGILTEYYSGGWHYTPGAYAVSYTHLTLPTKA